MEYMEYVAGVYGVTLLILGGATLFWHKQLKQVQQRLAEEQEAQVDEG
ncbi:heme exporter protein CcmD [Magnetococcus marinus]|nr:heme exporter protein CcmD [Magnetococcus marinus]